MTLHVKRLDNDTVVNVAQLLRESVGSTRIVALHLDQFALDADLTARDVEGEVRLLRVETGILASGQLSGVATVECVRCLEPFDARFAGEFDAEFRPSVDVRTGEGLPLPEDSEIFVIDNNHELDLAEVLRQVAIVSLPMRAICREDCPGIEPEREDEDELPDDRLAVLRDLLDDQR